MLENSLNKKCIYHYTSAESFFKILERMQLKVSKYQDANDLAEVQLPLGMDAFKSSDCYMFIRERCGYISFSKDYFMHEKGIKYPAKGYKIPTMWAYYANSNKGVCIVVDEQKFLSLNKNILGKHWLQNVKYKRFVNKNILEPLKNMPSKDIVKEYKDRLFFQKHKSWSHEHERRLCIIDPPQFLSIKDCIHEVILGNRFEKSDMLKLISMLQNPNFECYQQFNRHDFNMQSNIDGMSSTLDDPFIKLDFEIERINTFLQ